MNIIPVWARRSHTILVTLTCAAVMSSAQNAPLVSPPLTMRPGAILTVRINQPLSSDQSQVGDVFSATLTQPVIVLGIVVARYGQNVAGSVVEAKKAGRVSGVSRLGITLTHLTLVDGQTVPIQSQVLVREGPTSVGRDSAAIAGTTGLGATIGAAAGWGKGAAIGAGIGAAAGTIGVLLTRGHPTVVEPETPLTFEVTAPVTIETNNAPQAFRFVEPADYPSPQSPFQRVLTYPVPVPAAYPYPYYYAPLYYPYYYPYWGYPYFYGPSFSLFFGYPGHHGRVYAPQPVRFRGGLTAYTLHGGAHH